MFFSSRKKAKLEEEGRRQKQQRIQEEVEKERQNFVEAHKENLATFYRICDMVCCLPKKRHIVVIQRENVFKSDSDRNRAYFELARRLQYEHQSTGTKWLSAFGKNQDALYAFYEPTKLCLDFEIAINKISKDGYRIHRIRYYSKNI